MPRHTIPPVRDRLQSRILVWIAIPILCWLVATTLHQLLIPTTTPVFNADVSWAALISLCFGLAAFALRAATPAAAACGSLICFLLIESSQRLETLNLERRSILQSGLVPLILLFLLTFAATKLGHRPKANADLSESRRGRNAAQILANLGVAGIAAAMAERLLAPQGYEFTGPTRHTAVLHVLAGLFLPALAALTEATADTVSSEIGQAFGGTPRMILTLRSVPPGTDGAITLTGTLAGIVAGALVAASAIPALGLSAEQAAIAAAAGTAGLFFDSLLGATVERRGWIGNDLVNLCSTAFAAVVAAAAAPHL